MIVSCFGTSLGISRWSAFILGGGGGGGLEDATESRGRASIDLCVRGGGGGGIKLGLRTAVGCNEN